MQLINSINTPVARMFDKSCRARDGTGAELSLQRPAERIVCLTATGVDSLLELNLEPVGYLANGIALSSWDGKQGESIASVGSWMFPDLEAIRRLQPDSDPGLDVSSSLVSAVVVSNSSYLSHGREWV